MTVSELSSSLVREFLSRKGLKSTLAVLDVELPRTPESISNRSVLAREMRIESLLAKNKKMGNPYRTIIEVMVEHFIQKSSADASVHSQKSAAKMSIPKDVQEHRPALKTGADQEKSQLLDLKKTTTTSLAEEKEAVDVFGNPITSHATSPFRNPHHRRDAGAKNPFGKKELLTSTSGDHKQPKSNFTDSPPLPTTKDSTSVRIKREQHRHHLGHSSSRSRGPNVDSSGTDPFAGADIGIHGKLETEYTKTECRQDVAYDNSGTLDSGAGERGTIKESKDPTLLLYEDLEDLDLSVPPLPQAMKGHTLSQPVSVSGQPISLEQAKELRKLIFGTAKGPSFNAEWRMQGLSFSDVPNLEFGIIQHKGGPCGVLASLQAYVMKHLLFSDSQRSFSACPHPTPEERDLALAVAISEVLWKAGGKKRATVALLGHESHFTLYSSYKPDHITEKLNLFHFNDVESVRQFVLSNIQTFKSEDFSGCILFMVSAIMSRGIQNIRQDMDEKGGCLLGAHGYCTQELVNLLLCGVAVSNVFDGSMELASGGSTNHLLRGIPTQNDVGFLSLFEHYGSCVVGSNYKDPVLPIWVVCSESHFTVLFSLQRELQKDWLRKQMFDLYYYDGLAGQDDMIQLTIDSTREEPPPLTESELIPPLELCIRTKWKSAAVNWNKTEPIL